MSCFKTFISIFAVIGVILTSIIIYLGFYPKTIKPQDKIVISNILKCNTDAIKINGVSDDVIKELQSFDPKDLDNLLSQYKDQLPPEALNELNNNSSQANDFKQLGDIVDSVSKGLGSAGDTKLSVCVTKDDSKTTMTAIDNYFKSKDKAKYFSSGTLESMIDQLNKIPLVNIPKDQIKVPTTVVRSTYCSRPIHKSDIYLFSFIDNPQMNTVTMYNLDLNKEQNQSSVKKFVSNLVESGQYVKAKVYCNGN